MSISNGAYQNEFKKLPISTGNPVTMVTSQSIVFTLISEVSGRWMCALTGVSMRHVAKPLPIFSLKKYVLDKPFLCNLCVPSYLGSDSRT